MVNDVNIATTSLGQLLPEYSMAADVANIAVTGLSIDSRKVKAGYIFVAVEGVHVHGRQYIEQAVQSGAVAILTDADEDQISVDYVHNVPMICLPLLGDQLSRIAGIFYNNPTKSLPVVGVTGTNGKTTISQLFAQLSAMLNMPSGVVGTMGYGSCQLQANSDTETSLSLVSTGMTTPDAISTQHVCAQLLADGSDNIVMEVSSHGLTQGRVADIDFDVAVFSNLSHDHLDYHGDMSSYAKAKSTLFSMSSLTSAVINLDDQYSSLMMQSLNSDAQVLTYSLHDSSATLFLSDIAYGASQTSARLHVQNDKTYVMKTQLVGAFNLSNLLAVVATWLAINKEQYDCNDIKNIEKILEKVALLKPIAGRMELIPNSLERHVLIDFAHTPDALKNVLQSVRAYAKNNVFCLFGCGGDRDTQKRSLMAEAAEQYSDRIVVTSDNPRSEDPNTIIADICQGFSAKKHEAILDRKQAIETIIRSSQIGDVIVIAGKGHEDYQIIGRQKFPFSDQQIARITLREMEAKADD